MLHSKKEKKKEKKLTLSLLQELLCKCPNLESLLSFCYPDITFS